MKQLLIQLQLRRLTQCIDEMTTRQRFVSSFLESSLLAPMRFDGGGT